MYERGSSDFAALRGERIIKNKNGEFCKLWFGVKVQNDGREPSKCLSVFGDEKISVLHSDEKANGFFSVLCLYE